MKNLGRSDRELVCITDCPDDLLLRQLYLFEMSLFGQFSRAINSFPTFTTDRRRRFGILAYVADEESLGIRSAAYRHASAIEVIAILRRKA